MSSLAKVGVALLILALTAVGESSLEQLVRQQDWEAALQVADELISADSADAKRLLFGRCGALANRRQGAFDPGVPFGAKLGPRQPRISTKRLDWPIST